VVYSGEAQINDFKNLQDFLFFGHTNTNRLSERNREFDEFVGSLKNEVSATLVQRFEQEIKNNPQFGYQVSADAGSVFYIEIFGLSLVQKNTFSKYYKSHLTARVKLKDKSGNVLVSEVESITAFSSRTPEYMLDEYQTDRVKLREAFLKAAESLAVDLANEI
jgi:hypothetical protein